MMAGENPMRALRIAKVTLNFGAGKNAQLLERGVKLLEKVAGKPPVQTITHKRIPNWDLRPGLPIGAKLTLRGAEAEKIVGQLLTAKEMRLSPHNFDASGNVAFGVPEYIEITGMKYDPDIGMLGFEVAVTIERPGFRIKRRRLHAKKIPPAHRVTKDESIAFMTAKYGITVE